VEDDMLMRFAVVTMAWAALAAPAAAQGRGPEQERLSAMVGRWQTEVEIKATATAPASKVIGTEECAWFANLHVVCRNDAKADSTAYTAIRLMSYHTVLKRYAVYTVDSTGAVLLAFGQVSGDTWTFGSENAESKSRFVMTLTPTGYTGTSEVSGRKGEWTPVSSVKAARLEP
jgi:hypothetical protein